MGTLALIGFLLTSSTLIWRGFLDLLGTLETTGLLADKGTLISIWTTWRRRHTIYYGLSRGYRHTYAAGITHDCWYADFHRMTRIIRHTLHGRTTSIIRYT